MFKKLFFFSSFIFTLILCEYSYTLTNEKRIDKSYEQQNKLEIKVEYKENKKYISLKAQSDDLFPYILFCKTKDCNKRDDAYLVSDRLTMTQHLFVEKSDLINYFGYFTIYTIDNNFNGRIIIEAVDNILIPRDASYSFFVEKTDFVNTFEIPRLNNEKQDEKAIMTFSINTPFECDFSCIYQTKTKEYDLEESIHFDQGYILTFKELELEEDSKYICKVNNKHPNNFIIFNSKKYIGNKGGTEKFYNFYPNSKAIEGILKKNLLNEECFIAIPPKRIDEKSNFALSLTLFKGKAHISIRNTQNITINVYRLHSYNNEFKVDYETLYDQNTYFCVTEDDNQRLDDIIYSLQLIDLFSDLKRADFYSPQMHGLMYRRQTPGKKVVFFHHTKRNNKKGDYTYFYMRVIRGNAEMYIHTCDDFPNCNYDINKIDNIKNSYTVNNINNIYYGKFLSSNEKSPVSSIQNLFVVACKSTRSCIYETLIYDSEDKIKLKPFHRFSQFLSTGQTDLFKFNVHEDGIEKVIVGLYTISGDVKLSAYRITDVNINKTNTFLMNKQEIIYTSTSFNNEFNVFVTAMKNSFYSIEYRLVRKNNDTVILLQGSSYLETIYTEKRQYKSIYIMHYGRNRTNSCFQSFFYGLNCKFSIEREKYNSTIKKEITKNNFLGIDIIPNNTESIDEDYKIRLLKYNVKFEIMDDVIQNENIPCMFYISSLQNSYNKEQQSNSSYRDRELLISENINYNIKINKNNKGMRFVYPHTNINQNIFIQFNKEDKEELSIYFYFNNNPTYMKSTISYSQMLIIDKSKFTDNCKLNELCKILIDISVNKDLGDREVNFSFNLKTENKTPIYIKKGLMRIDTIPGNSIMYYYTDIGKFEEGEVIVNFDRGNGNVYGKLINKEIIENKSPDWMGFISFPKKNQSNLLNFEIDAKKIIYSNRDTEICINSCFLLITVENIVDSFMSQKILYDISLIVRVNNLYENQYIEIMLDKFIVGKLYPKEIGESIYHYYNFKIPKNTNKILIEQQNDIYDIYAKKGISIDDSSRSYKFSPTGINNIYEISSKEIIKKGEYFSLKIGISKIEYYFQSVYIFRVRIPENDIDLIPVNSGQNTLCNYTNVEKMCYYLISNNGNKDKIYIHAYNDNLSSKINLYISKIKKNDLINNDTEKIKKLLPSKNSDNSEKNLRTDFYIDSISEDNDIIVGVNSNKLGIITLLTSFENNLKSLNADSSSYQLIYLNQNENINLYLPSNMIFMIKFVSIEGSGKIKIGNSIEKFEIKSHNDYFSSLVNLNLQPITIEANYNLLLYVYYEYRGNVNFEEIEYGKSGHFYYDDTRFFLIYYCKVPEIIEDVDIIINIKNYYIKGEEYNTNPTLIDNDFKAFGMIVGYDIILKKKKEPNINPNNKNIIGEFDPSLQVIKLKFKKEFIENEKVKNKYFYITVQKESLKNTECKTILTEYSVFPSKINANLAPYNQYYFGNLTNDYKTRAIFKLTKNILGDKYMKIEYSTNNDKVKFAFSEKNFGNEEIKNEIKSIIENEKNGKKIKIIQLKDNIHEIYLYIYSNEKPGLNQFTFKYSTTIEKEDFYDYDFDGKIKINKNEKERKLELKLKKLSKSKNNNKLNNLIPVTYYVRLILNEELNQLNLTPKTITFLNVNTERLYKKYVKGDEIEINMIIDKYPIDKKYDIIIMAITDEPISEILFYDYLQNPFDFGKSSKSYLIIIFIIIIIAIFVVILIKFYNINKEKNDYKKQIDQLSLACGNNADNQTNSNVDYNFISQ